MKAGVCAGFGFPVGTERQEAFAVRGLVVIRQDLQTDQGWTPDIPGILTDGAAWEARGGRMLYICTPDTLPLVPDGSWVSLYNEPNLRMTPEAWANAANALRGVIEGKRLVFWAYGISNLDRSALDWLRKVVPLCSWPTRVEVHRYSPGTDQNCRTPHKGFSSREMEVVTLRDIIGERAFMVGECGYHTGPMKVGWLKPHVVRLTPAEQQERLQYEVQFWDAQGAQACCIFQEQDSPDYASSDQYGLRYAHLGPFKSPDATYGPPLPTPQPPTPTPGGRVTTFKSWHGFYLSAQPDGTLQANRPEAGAWEEFTAEPQTDGWVAYRSCFGTYLCAEPDGRMVCNRPSPGPWESFRSVPGYEGKGIGLQTWHGTFMRASDDGLTVNQAPDCGPWETWDLGHVDPSIIPLETLATIRGGMWVNRAAIPYGPRPMQPDNINAMDYYQWYNATDRATMLAAYRAQGYTHAVTGPVIDSGGYHGQYPVYPGPLTQEWWDTYLDAMQEWWDAGIIPVHFALPEDLPMDRWITQLDPFFRQARAQRLLRIIVLAWEPGTWRNADYVQAATYLKATFPNALLCVHLTPDHNAPGLSSEIESGMTEAQMWANLAPHIHVFLQQTAVLFDGTAADKTEWLQMWDRNYPGSWDSRFLDGYHGWPTFSAWGTHGILAYPSEYMSYDCYWHNTPESVAQDWGNLAMASGARGYLDGGTVSVKEGV